VTLLVGWPAVTDDDGSKLVGTVYNKALTDAIKASVHSAGNPTIKAKDIIDEVKAARGTKASVDARLDVFLNEDGTPKTIAGVATSAQLQSQVGARNVAKNGELTEWSKGAADAPDEFALTGAGATVARTGPAEADTFTFGAGKYAVKVTRAGADCYLTEDVIVAADFANNSNCKGQKFSVLVKCKTASPVNARIAVTDGVTVSYSGYHTGGGAEETLSVVHTISGTATVLQVLTEQKVNGATYWGGFTYSFSDVTATDWSPLSREPIANQTRRGTVDTKAQTFGGHKAHTPGLAAAVAQLRGLLDVQFNTKGIVNGNETDAHTYTLLANTFNADKRVVKVTAWGLIGAGAGNKTIKFYLGVTPITILPASPTTSNTWRAEIYIIRTASNTQEMIGSVLAASGITGLAFAAAAIADNADIVMKTTIQSSGATAGDITEEGMMVEVVG
jgi:hypothetical protein